MCHNPPLPVCFLSCQVCMHAPYRLGLYTCSSHRGVTSRFGAGGGGGVQNRQVGLQAKLEWGLAIKFPYYHVGGGGHMDNTHEINTWKCPIQTQCVG